MNPILKGILKSLLGLVPWAIDRATGKPKTRQELKADLAKKKAKANEDVEDAIADRFPAEGD